MAKHIKKDNIPNSSYPIIKGDPLYDPEIDLSKDPYFAKKNEEAWAFLKEHPLPESFTKKKI